jgi:hypothetical protein
MAELHIDYTGELRSVVEPAEDSQYARELDKVRERLATGPQAEELAELLLQENNLLLCLASLRWMRAMTQLQAEGVLSREVGQRPLALGKASYYAQRTRDNYYKVWRIAELVVAIEVVSQGSVYYNEGKATFGSITLNEGGSWVYMPAYDLPVLHHRDYQNMIAVVTGHDDVQVTTCSSIGGYRTQWHRRDGTVWAQLPGSYDVVQQPAQAARLPEFTKCRVCGCTNDDCRQCIAASGQPCAWAAPYLCTRCYVEQKEGALGKEVPGG